MRWIRPTLMEVAAEEEGRARAIAAGVRSPPPADALRRRGRQLWRRGTCWSLSKARGRWAGLRRASDWRVSSDGGGWCVGGVVPRDSGCQWAQLWARRCPPRRSHPPRRRALPDAAGSDGSGRWRLVDELHARGEHSRLVALLCAAVSRIACPSWSYDSTVSSTIARTGQQIRKRAYTWKRIITYEETTSLVEEAKSTGEIPGQQSARRRLVHPHSLLPAVIPTAISTKRST